MKPLLLGLLFVNLLGCVSATPQSEKLLNRSEQIPKAYQIAGVPFVQQTKNYCGPATLTMALRWAGQTADLEDVAKQVYTPGVEGSLQSDMISAGRRQGMVVIPIEGMQNLFQEVSSGYPVVVFENLALSWLPQWHYAIVFGYDLDRPAVLMHSGSEANKWWDLRKFERSWKLADYWGMVLVPPGKLAASADEVAHVKATAALESLKNYPAAHASYKAILHRWPASFGAIIGLANIAYTNHQYKEAVLYLKQAVRDHPNLAAAWHNLAIAQMAAKQNHAAKISAQRALSLAAVDEVASYKENFAEILK